MMTSSPPPLSSTLVRPFPTEVFIRVLVFCTSATLAVCCRVSRDFLVLASEPLWTDVVLSSPEQLQLLFRSVSRRHQSSCPALPASLAPHLSLSRIDHLTLTSSSILHASLIPGSRFQGPLRPSRMVLQSPVPVRTSNQSLFGPLRPKQLVHIFPRDDFASYSRFDTPPAHPHLRTAHVVVVIQNSIAPAGTLYSLFDVPAVNEIGTLFFGYGGMADLTARVPKHPTSLRFVLLPSACMDREALVGFLATRHRGGALDPEWFRGREGSVVVEVPTEEAKGWVETGKPAIPVASRKLVVVEVGAVGAWEEGRLI